MATGQTRRIKWFPGERRYLGIFGYECNHRDEAAMRVQAFRSFARDFIGKIPHVAAQQAERLS